MLNMMKWCRITAIDLLNADIQADRVKRHAAELGHCASLAHLNLFGNEIGAEGAGRLAAVLGQCASLAHLDLGFNEIGDEGRESCGSARALCITCSSESYGNGIGAEGAGRLAAVAEHCPSLTISG